MENEINFIIEWIKNYVKNSGAKGVVIGNSGGKDSATVIALCVKALGKDNVLAVAMPCSSIQKDLEDAKLIASTFGVKMLTVNLSSVYKDLSLAIENEINDTIVPFASINIRPRLRMTTLYTIAQQYGYLVAGTGNACEGFVGYTTKWGDNACDFNPIAEFNVSEVLEIGKVLGVPSEIINKAPNDGLGMGTDEEKLGVTYKEIEEYIATGKTEKKSSSEKIEKLHKQSEHKRNPIPVYHRNI
ncbi:MAG: NAD(+) synthase [Clostridia bacterium]